MLNISISGYFLSFLTEPLLISTAFLKAAIVAFKNSLEVITVGPLIPCLHTHVGILKMVSVINHLVNRWHFYVKSFWGWL